MIRLINIFEQEITLPGAESELSVLQHKSNRSSISYPIQRFSIGSTSPYTSELSFPYISGPQNAEYCQTIGNFVPTTIPSILNGFINIFEFKDNQASNSDSSSFLTMALLSPQVI